MGYCPRCHVPDTLPLDFDGDNVCSICRSYSEPEYLGLEALKREVERFRNPDGRYDCIIPLSGGKDSSYLCYLASRVLGLRVLAVSYDSGFRHPVAGSNIDKLERELGIDIKIVKSPHGDEVSFVRHFLMAARKAGVYWGICTFCHYAIEASVYREARSEGINLILWGNTHHENLWVGMKDKYRMLFSELRGIGPAGWVGFLYHAAVSAIYLFKLRSSLYLPPVRNLFTVSTPPYPPEGIHNIRVFLNFIRWDAEQIIGTLEREIGWEMPAAGEATERFDCLLEPFVNHSWKRSFGLTTKQVISSNLYRSKHLTDNEIDRIYSSREDGERLAEAISEVYRKLGIDE